MHRTAIRLSIVCLALAWAATAAGCGGKAAGTSAPDARGLASGGNGGTASGGRADSAMGEGTGGASPTTVVGSGGDMPSESGGALGGGRTDAGQPGSGGLGAKDAAAAGGKTGSGGASPSVPSSGCGKAPPASGRSTLAVSGTQREYILKIPDGYDANHPYRLIFGFHGAKYNDDWVADGGAPLTGPFFGLESEAKGDAIFVAPQASSAGFSSQDLPFVDAMVAQLEAQLCIDKNRVFSAGFSMGAIMTINLGCNRGDVFRAIAPMSGSLPSPCPAGSPVAYWASHGTSDTTISPAQGQAARDEFVTRNHCTKQTSAPDGNNCVTYQGCDQGYPVVWCTFSGQHEPAPFAGAAIWQFLSIF